MDFAKFRQAIEDVRRHLDAGEKESAITGFSEALGVDRTAATAAVEQIAAGEMVTVTESSMTGPGGAGGGIDKIMEAVAGGGLTARLFKMGGVDLTKIRDALEAGGDGNSVVTSQTTVSVSGGKGRRSITITSHGHGAEPARSIEDAAIAPPAEPRSANDPVRHVSVVNRPHGRTVERPANRGMIVVVIVLAVMAGVAIALLLR
ncbi:MAG TPA: hypothetical protein VMQ73_05945 [Methylomirabilota bacterium]|nr:hypothetical protein [Methylomirabilota bacterium]